MRIHIAHHYILKAAVIFINSLIDTHPSLDHTKMSNPFRYTSCTHCSGWFSQARDVAVQTITKDGIIQIHSVSCNNCKRPVKWEYAHRDFTTLEMMKKFLCLEHFFQ